MREQGKRFRNIVHIKPLKRMDGPATWVSHGDKYNSKPVSRDICKTQAQVSDPEELVKTIFM